ncbi:family 2B encapsulin nanocompartment shell protein [Pseudonocardia eucalypti]|uniref:Family 2B encapsulin nanocompartment shell protein n=1 Tax=Pseudonocardia eucalypti TaxID=648755 RepID=A0ABP9QPA8_9PSEU|nr:CRP-like cAMP-binding protein [Pseudonocardia eucalypti]
MTEVLEPGTQIDTDQPAQSLSTAAARNLATTTKSVPQMQGITSRWLLRKLPWVEAAGGAYRVNRRLSYVVGDGRLTFTNVGDNVSVVPGELRELALLRDFQDPDSEAILAALAERFTQREYAQGEVIVEFGHQADALHLIAHGKVDKAGVGKYGEPTRLGVLAGGDYFGDQELAASDGIWEFTARAVTRCTVLSLSKRAFAEQLDRSEALRAHVEAGPGTDGRVLNDHGEAAIDVASGHAGEPAIPSTFVDYELAPREYELSVAQTVLRMHTRVADLYNKPMDQLDQQLRLTIEALRERQEHEIVNNREFGLLHSADMGMRVPTRNGPPTPDEFDELLAMVWKEPGFFLAHPRTIAAFGRECTKRGIYPTGVDVGGHKIPAWRDIPIFPCNKIPVSESHASSVMLMRVGEQNQGVVGLHQTGIPDEYQPGLSVRFMGINDNAITSYLVSAYYSAAVLVPDALAVLEDVEVGRTDSEG